MKLTKQQILDFNEGLNAVRNLPGAKFAYAVARNMAKLQPELIALEAAMKPKEAFNEYDKERADIAAKHAEKNEDGSPKIAMGQYIISDQDALSKALEPVKEKHKAAIEERDQQLKDFEELLKEETDIDIYTINEIFLPESITGSQINGILLMIEEKTVN